MWNEDWYSQAFSGWEEGGGGNTAVEQRELNHFSTCGLCILWQKLMFFWLVLPPAWSEAGSRRSMEQRNNFAPWLSVQLRFRAWKSRNRGVELAEQLSPFRLFFFFFSPSSHEPFFLVVRALMFISPGMSSPALSHRFHTFLLANLTVLLPAAESGARSQRSSETVLLLLLLLPLSSGLGVPGGIGGGEGGSHLSHNK